MEEDLGWRTTLDEKQPWVEDDLEWIATLDGRRPWMEDDLGIVDEPRLKMTLGL